MEQKDLEKIFNKAVKQDGRPLPVPQQHKVATKFICNDTLTNTIFIIDNLHQFCTNNTHFKYHGIKSSIRSNSLYKQRYIFRRIKDKE